MKKKLVISITGLLLLIPSLLIGQSNIRSLFPERPKTYLTDLAGVVNNPGQVNDQLKTIRDSLKLSLVAVTFKTIGDYAVEDVAREIGREWKVATANDTIGAAIRNTGGVIVLVLDTHKCRIEVATGSEGYLTDLRARNLCVSARPEFRSGQFGDGIIKIAHGFAQYHTEELASASKPITTSISPGHNPLFIILVALVVIVLIVGILVLISHFIAKTEEEAFVPPSKPNIPETPFVPGPFFEQSPRTIIVPVIMPISESIGRSKKHEDDEEDDTRKSFHSSDDSFSFGGDGSSDSDWSSGGSDSFSGGGGGSDW